MILNESIVGSAPLAMPIATLTPALSQGERKKCAAIRLLNPAIPEEGARIHKESLSVQVNRRPTP